jgi:hypothetical protein
MPTVQDCINGLRVSYPQVEDAQALQYFRDVHREILSLAQIETEEETLDLTAGQREYATQTTTVRAAYHARSASDVTRLIPTSTDWLDDNRPNWRQDQQRGRPTAFFIEDGKVGLDPVPDTTTVAGFPKLVLYGSAYQALVAVDPIPAAVPSIRVYVEGMKKLYASDRDPDRFAQWDANYQRELHELVSQIF